MSQETQISETVVTVDKSNKQKKVITIVGIAVALILVVVIGVILASSNSGKKLQEQLDLGNKYLDEMDYERALVAFNAVLEIDPRNADAYLGIVEAYVGMGDMEKALEAARKGYDLTEDARLLQKINELSASNGSAGNGDGAEVTTAIPEETTEEKVQRLLKEGAGDDLISSEDITFWGTKATELDMENARSLAPGNGFPVASYEDHTNGNDFIIYSTGKNRGSQFMYSVGTDFSRSIHINDILLDGYETSLYRGEFGRGFQLTDSVADVLEKLGFTNAEEIAAYYEGHWSGKNEYEIEPAPVGYMGCDGRTDTDLDIFYIKFEGGIDQDHILDGDIKIECYFKNGVNMWMNFDEDAGLYDVSVFISASNEPR